MFGAPNDLADHADAATGAAVLIHRLVAEDFQGAVRIGIGMNTGTVNVAARVEQLTGDAILLTRQPWSPDRSD